MTAGLGLLRLPPAVFWTMTMAELRAALHAVIESYPNPAPPSRSEVIALLKRYPDQGENRDG